MNRVQPHLLVAVFVIATASAAGAYTILRSDSNRQRTVALADVHHYNAAEVRATFERRGIRLRYGNDATPGVWLSATPLPVPVTSLYVLIAQGEGHVSWGPEPNHAFEATVGNILIHYGGSNTRLLAEVRAAAADVG